MAISLCLGWRNNHLRPVGLGDPYTTPNSVILPHRSPDSGCFALILLLFNITFLNIHIASWDYLLLKKEYKPV